MADSLDSGSSAHSGRAGSSPASRTNKKALKLNGFKAFFFAAGALFSLTFSLYRLIPSLNSGKWAVSNTFLTGVLEETGCHFLGKQLLPLHIQVPVNVCGHLNVGVAHVLLHILQGAAAVEKQACAAMPEFVETDVRQVIVFQQQGKMRGYVIRGKRLAVRPFENKIVFFILNNSGMQPICR